MSATTNRLLRHMAWANQKVYDAVKGQPDQALTAYIVNPEWTASHILKHIVDGADWYLHCLTESPLRDIKMPNSMSDLDLLQSHLAEIDSKIAKQAELADEYLAVIEDGGSWRALRSTILAQAIYHAGEHRTQLVDALESKGLFPILLDNIDMWNFESFEEK